MTSAWALASSAATGATNGMTEIARARLWARAWGAGAGAACGTAVVAASKRGNEDNIRVLLLCAPVRARRETPSATWATRLVGSCLGGWKWGRYHPAEDLARGFSSARSPKPP